MPLGLSHFQGSHNDELAAADGRQRHEPGADAGRLRASRSATSSVRGRDRAEGVMLSRVDGRGSRKEASGGGRVLRRHAALRRRRGAARPRPVRRGRRVPDPGGAVGVREEHRAPAAGRSRQADLGGGQASAAAPSRAGPGRARHRDGLPELRALPPHERLQEPRLRAAAAQDPQGRDRPPGARDGGPAGHRSSCWTASRPALGRSAAAGRDGTRTGTRAAGVPARRAAVQPGREAPHPGAGRSQAAAPRAAGDLDLRDARPGRGDDPRRPDLRHVERRGPADRDPRRDLQPAGQHVRRGVHGQPADEPGAGRDPRRERPRRRGGAGRGPVL